MSSEKIKEWTSKRGQAKGSITRIAGFAEGMNKDTRANEVSSRLELLERAFNGFTEADAKLTALDCASEIDEIEAKYITLKVKLSEFITTRATASVSIIDQFKEVMARTTAQQNDFLSKFSETVATSLNQSFLNQSSEEPHFTARLPRLHVPIFDGDYKEFHSFKDIFMASVHNKPYLANVEKFQYLRSCLKGEPAELIRHLNISDANYKAAWSKICDRYDKRNIAISHFIQTFLDIPPVKEKSAKKLRNIHNIADQVIRGLQAMGEEAETRDHWLLHILLMKTDAETQQAWAFSTDINQNPTFENFLQFISKRCDGLEPCESTSKPHQGKSMTVRSHTSSIDQKYSSIRPCPLCQQPHKLFECEKFKRLETMNKRDEVIKMNACFNCLSTSHRVNKCQSRRSCNKCGRRHHSLLHDGVISNVSSTPLSTNAIQNEQPFAQSNVKVSSPIASSSSHPCDVHQEAQTVQLNSNKESNAKVHLACTGYAILPTAIVSILDRFGRAHECSALLDSGSQVSFISHQCAKKLQLSSQRANIIVSGLATSNTTTKGTTSVVIRSRFNDSSEIRLNVFILGHITTTSQYECLNNQNANQFDDLQLADPTYFNKKTIDILIGADYFFSILKHGKLIVAPTAPIAQETIFGWVISGQSQSKPIDDIKVLKNTNISLQDETNLDTILKRFWELEAIGTENEWNEEENKCELHFKTTTKRDVSGRFIVQLPFKIDMPSLGNTYVAAKHRLLAMERKMTLNPIFGQLYHEFIEEYESLGHMTKLTAAELDQEHGEVCYLPHHGVWKLNSETTKLRVVFDGSCLSSNGVSLNNKLRVGPIVQPSLWTILLRFRQFPIALCADIEKMYRQVLIDPSQCKYQRILWRTSKDKPIDSYQLKTVTYGTSAASFLSTRALVSVAEENEQNFPTVAKVIRQNFYVDDLLTGAKDEIEAANLKSNLILVLNNYGFPLRKWKSNIEHLADHSQSISFSDQQNVTHVLGLIWDPTNDNFHFNVNIPTENVYTKRTILSIISRIYDPLGWLSPFIIKTKLMMQYLWLAKVSWDEEIPEELQKRWNDIKSEFECIKQIKIPRWIGSILSNIEVHGFSDASELGYAACIYFRVRSNDKMASNLITSKSKVAPIQSVSLPRLELCGAHLLARLVTNVCQAFELTTVPIYLWTDSTVVLSWLQSGPPRVWKVYVANRTAEIHKLVPKAIWRHVSSGENPSDLATRGIKPTKLISNELWWKGPKWLYKHDEPWPKVFEVRKTKEERRLNVIGLQANKNEDITMLDEMIDKTEKWMKLVRILSTILRFISNLRNPRSKKSGFLTTEELSEGESTIIRHIQQQAFAADVSNLRSGKQLKSKSALLSLSPFIDKGGLLRVGGRLKNATCSYAIKHPMIIPKGHKVSMMILNYLHAKHLHPGPSLLVSLSRMKYWIIGVRGLVRTVCRKCITCFRYSTHTSTQLMGNLPSQRVTPARPFSRTGVDYAGPIMLASKRGRGSKLIKGYIVLFVCLCTKALHIEVAGDMTTATFMGALRRFTSRRGVPSLILSDNGSNFRGANHLLSDLYRTFQTDEYKGAVHQYATDFQIKWSFIPPLAPNFGGIWERAVRSIKAHLVKVVGNSHLTYEEMATVLAQIECILNSRPLCLINNEDATNIDALTPAHFLILTAPAILPDENYNNIAISRLTRWQLVQQLVQSYWKRYSIDYLHTLQQRTTSKFKERNLQINDIVLVKDEANPPGIWPLAKIIEVHPGNDGIVRVATIKTKQSTFKRPISKLFRLPLDDDDHIDRPLKPLAFNEGELCS